MLKKAFKLAALEAGKLCLSIKLTEHFEKLS